MNCYVLIKEYNSEWTRINRFITNAEVRYGNICHFLSFARTRVSSLKMLFACKHYTAGYARQNNTYNIGPGFPPRKLYSSRLKLHETRFYIPVLAMNHSFQFATHHSAVYFDCLFSRTLGKHNRIVIVISPGATYVAVTRIARQTYEWQNCEIGYEKKIKFSYTANNRGQKELLSGLTLRALVNKQTNENVAVP